MSSQHRDTDTPDTPQIMFCARAWCSVLTIRQCQPGDSRQLSPGVWRLDAGAERAVASVHDNVIVGDSRDTGELTAASCVQCTVLYSTVCTVQLTQPRSLLRHVARSPACTSTEAAAEIVSPLSSSARDPYRG